MKNHLGDVNSSFCIDLKIEFLCDILNLYYLAERLNEFIQSRYNHIEVQSAKNLGFLFFDLESINLIVGDFVLHGSYANRVDFLILGGNKHTGHSSGVDILDFHRVVEFAVVVVHQVHCEEEGLIMTVVTAHDLNHPVNHLGPQAGADLLQIETLLVILTFLINQLHR